MNVYTQYVIEFIICYIMTSQIASIELHDKVHVDVLILILIAGIHRLRPINTRAPCADPACTVHAILKNS